MQIDFGLPRTRDAMQQGDAKFLAREFASDGGNRGLLFCVQHWGLRGHQLTASVIIGIGDAFDAERSFLQNTAPDQGTRHCGGDIKPIQDERFFLRTKLLFDEFIKSRLLRRPFLKLS